MKQWNNEALQWSVKRFRASISLPVFNASSLHCLNFLPFLMFYRFIASRVCLTCVKAFTKNIILRKQWTDDSSWQFQKKIIIFLKQSRNVWSSLLSHMYRKSSCCCMEILAWTHTVLTVTKLWSEVRKHCLIFS
jgi:hypothetical protein